jgi:hypothetical protein
MTKRIFAMVIIFILASMSAQAAWNLEVDSSKCMIAGGLTYTWNDNHAVGGKFSVALVDGYKYASAELGGNSNGCFTGKISGGGNIPLSENVSINIAASAGIQQVREDILYVNQHNNVQVKFSSPAPKLTFGALARFNYEFEKCFIFADFSYERAFDYGFANNSAAYWQIGEHTVSKNIISASVGFGALIREDGFRGGDMCFDLNAAMAYSWKRGLLLGLDFLKHNRLNEYMNHYYGVGINYFLGNGDAQIKAEYILSFVPSASNGWYSFGIGAAAVVGQYKASFGTTTLENPDIAKFAYNGHRIGGGFEIIAMPAMFQMGRVNIRCLVNVGQTWTNNTEAGGDFRNTVTSNKRSVFDVSGSVSVGVAL